MSGKRREIQYTQLRLAFATIVPEHPTVRFNWTEVEPDEVVRYRPALSRLAANVTYFGHSSSLVRVAVCDDVPTSTCSRTLGRRAQPPQVRPCLHLRQGSSR